MKKFTSKTQKIGEFGEKIATLYLKRNGHRIIENNYTIKEGEIDIISTKNNILYFFEVKSTRQLFSHEIVNPAENINKEKIKKCHRTIQNYLKSKNVSYETRWKLNGIIVYIDNRGDPHKIKIIENLY